jgi:hypothetical protein
MKSENITSQISMLFKMKRSAILAEILLVQHNKTRTMEKHGFSANIILKL